MIIIFVLLIKMITYLNMQYLQDLPSTADKNIPWDVHHREPSYQPELHPICNATINFPISRMPKHILKFTFSFVFRLDLQFKTINATQMLTCSRSHENKFRHPEHPINLQDTTKIQELKNKLQNLLKHKTLILAEVAYPTILMSPKGFSPTDLQGLNNRHVVTVYFFRKAMTDTWNAIIFDTDLCKQNKQSINILKNMVKVLASVIGIYTNLDEIKTHKGIACNERRDALMCDVDQNSFGLCAYTVCLHSLMIAQCADTFPTTNGYDTIKNLLESIHDRDPLPILFDAIKKQNLKKYCQNGR